MSTPASAARRRACSKSSGAMSRPTTFAPRRAAGMATLPPVPVPTSSRSRPGTDVDAIEDDRADGLDQPRAAIPVTGGPSRPGPAPEVLGKAHATTLTGDAGLNY